MQELSVLKAEICKHIHHQSAT